MKSKVKRKKKSKVNPKPIQQPSTKLVVRNQVSLGLEQLLTCTLALYVLVESKKPMYSLINQLHCVETNAAQLIDVFFQKRSEANPVALEGALASVLSYIQFPPTRISNPNNKKHRSR